LSVGACDAEGKKEFVMPIIMIIYYAITAYIVGMLIWNFIREKKSVDDMILYLVILVPLVLRLLRVK
jgi:phosphate starvation-inducible membrane PsiE